MISTKIIKSFLKSHRCTFTSQSSDNNPVILETEKLRSLKCKKWNEKLSSHSEAIVKADYSEHKTIEKLQEETIIKLNDENVCNCINSDIKKMKTETISIKNIDVKKRINHSSK